MGSFLRLAKALSKNTKSNNNHQVESAEDKEYQKYLESLTDKELDELIKSKLADFDNSDEGKAYNLRLSELTEAELTIELFEKLKVS